MAASVLSCVMSMPPAGFEIGAGGNTYTATYVVHMDAEVAFSEMLALARSVTAGGVHDNRPIPGKGDVFDYTSPPPDGGGAGTRTVDNNSICLDYEANHAATNDGLLWTVRVRWRPPAPGMWEEPLRVKPTRAFKREPNLHNRAPYRWIEYYTEMKDAAIAFSDDDLGQGSIKRPKNTPGLITTAAGEEVQPNQIELMHAVFVTEKFVKSQLIAHELNLEYEGSIAAESFIHPMVTRPISRRQGRFLRAEVATYPVWETGQEFWKMQLRIEIAREPIKIDVPNRGTLFYNPVSGEVETYRDPTTGVVQQTDLKLDGARLESGDKPTVIQYYTHRTADYKKRLLQDHM